MNAARAAGTVTKGRRDWGHHRALGGLPRALPGSSQPRRWVLPGSLGLGPGPRTGSSPGASPTPRNPPLKGRERRVRGSCCPQQRGCAPRPGTPRPSLGSDPRVTPAPFSTSRQSPRSPPPTSTDPLQRFPGSRGFPARKNPQENAEPAEGWRVLVAPARPMPRDRHSRRKRLYVQVCSLLGRYLSGMKREEWVAPMPGRPCFTGL